MLFIVLPTYNDAKSINLLFEALKEYLEEDKLDYHIILVNDGSSDDIPAIAKRFARKIPMSIINHPQNLGLGEAIKTGLTEATRKAKNKDFIVTMDADNTHTPGLILRMVRTLREGNDVVIASRYRYGAYIKGVNTFRRVLSRGASLLFSMLFHIPGVRDYTCGSCGYRAYRASILKKAFANI